MPAPDRKRRLTAFAVAMAVLIATPLAVVAADAFNDVPDSNVHHDDITWLSDNGVTAGCNPPDNTEFCPGDPVLRQQMASFMRRLAENQVVDAATALEADHATTADSADTADSATAAGDADTLDGFDATALVPGDMLPPGSTIRGTYIAGGTGPAGDGYVFTNIEFGYTLPDAPTANYLASGAAPTADCPGTFAEPEAAPGHLCIYETLRSNMSEVVVTDSAGTFGSASPFGALVGAEPVDISGVDPLVYGSWAVTAGSAGASSAGESGGPQLGR